MPDLLSSWNPTYLIVMPPAAKLSHRFALMFPDCTDSPINLSPHCCFAAFMVQTFFEGDIKSLVSLQQVQTCLQGPGEIMRDVSCFV